MKGLRAGGAVGKEKKRMLNKGMWKEKRRKGRQKEEETDGGSG